MKQIVLFIFLIIFTTFGFSQEQEKNNINTNGTVTKINAFPNPFNSKTTIFFDTNTTDDVTFLVQNILGKIVYKNTFKGKKGKNSIPFFKNNLSEGVYIYTISTNTNTYSKRLVIK